MVAKKTAKPAKPALTGLTATHPLNVSSLRHLDEDKFRKILIVLDSPNRLDHKGTGFKAVQKKRGEGKIVTSIMRMSKRRKPGTE